MSDRILITGGAGYVGSHTNKVLAQNGWETVVFDNLSTGHKELIKWGEVVTGDLGDINQIRNLFDTYKIAGVLHFAASAYVGESVKEPQKYYVNNVRNALNLLQVILECNVKYFIFSSTCSIYGNPITLPITENHPLDPINPYGRSKLMIERILHDYSVAYGLRYVSLRYFNAAGADPATEIGEWHDPETHLIPLVLSAALGKTASINVYGTDYNTADGTCIRDYVHVLDLAVAHVLSLKYLLSGGSCDVFNLGSGIGYSVRQVIDAAQNITGEGINIKITSRRPGDPPQLVANYTKAKKILNWQPQYNNLTPILETAWAWQKKQMFMEP